MENKEKPEPIYYELTDKHFWAAFLNLARHNVYTTINHINRRLEIAELKDDGYMMGIKGSWNEQAKKLDKKVRLRDLIMKHFPFLEAAAYEMTNSKSPNNKEQREKEQSEALSLNNLKNVLFIFLEKLQVLRNYYSHYKYSEESPKPTFETSLLKNMYKVFDANVRLVKRDYMHHENIDMQRDFTHLNRKKQVGRTKNIIDSPNFHYHFADKEGNMTIAGLLFFVSLFLDKKDAIWMQKKLKGFKDGRNLREQMTNEVFCRSRISLPKLKLENVQTKDWMQLDMLNELVRCPKSLYERLREKDRESFKVPFDIFSDDYDAEEEPFKNTLVRHQDRFPYFVLRYFDLNEIFEQLRFQIDLGTYHFSIYNKRIGDEDEVRHLTHHLYGFARIQDFAPQNQPEEWRKLVKDLDHFETSQKPYISKTAPHYHLENEKIGIKFCSTHNNLFPSLKREKTCNGRSKFNLGTQFTAEAFLSVHELLPMMFYYLLLTKDYSRKESADKVEGIIRKEISNIYAIYDAFANGEINSIADLTCRLQKTNILQGHLPKQMISILEGRQKDMEKEAEHKIGEMIDDTQRRLDLLCKQTNQKIRIGKRNAGLLKSGKIADWLVSDMMRFQPVQKDTNNAPINNSKANSTEYRMLQHALALFGSESSRLKAYFRQMNLVGNANPHPFLAETQWEHQTNILSFYRNYLEARKKYLKGLKPQNWKQYQHFLILKVQKTNRNTLVTGWKNSFNLPRGIFTQPIREWFEKHNNSKRIYDQILSFGRVGFVAKAIPLYFAEECKDCVQPFYDYPFNVGNKLKPKKGQFLDKKDRVELWQKNKELFKNYPPEKRKTDLAYLDFLSWKKFERELRLIKNQDIVTWLMFKELFKTTTVEGLKIGEIHLRDIDTNTANEESNNILNRIMPMKLPVKTYETDNKGNILKERPLATFYIEETETKVLKQGNFKVLAKDRRLNGLLSFAETTDIDLEKNPITKLSVDHELIKYQTTRISIFEMTLGLEKKLIDKYSTLPTDSFRNMLERWLQCKANRPELKNYVNSLIAVRNAFSHNQYPMYDATLFAEVKKFTLFPSVDTKKIELNIAPQLLEIVGKAIKEIEKSENKN